MKPITLGAVLGIALLAIAPLVRAQTGTPPATTTPAPTTAPARPTPPTRDPRTPGYVTATELPDGTVPSPRADGNFIIGPTHDPAPEMSVREGVPQDTEWLWQGHPIPE